MRRLMNIIMLSCRKATELIEKQLYFGLSPLERVKLRMHMLLCDYCCRYKKQSLFLHKLLGGHDHDHPASDVPAIEENAELKEKILNQIEKS